MDFNDFEIYKGKTFAQLCKEIVVNQNQKKDQIDILISELRPLIKTVQDAMMVVPMIHDYYDVSVRNDEQLVKLAMVIQRIISKSYENENSESGPFMLSESEKKELMKEIDGMKKDISEPIKKKEEIKIETKVESEEVKK